MYQAHKMEVLLFRREEVYVTEWASDGEEGEDQYSIRSGQSTM